jgi:oligopeptide transport system substrate-binding protein
MAIDRDALVEGVLQGAALSTTTWVAPGEPGYDPNAGTGLAFDAKGAQAELAKAGYANGKDFPEVTFLAVDQPMARVLGQFIEDQLKQNLNIDVKTEYLDGPTYGARFTGNQAQATVIRWGADWPYPDNWLPSLFSSNSPNNHLGYNNVSFDQFMTRAAAETDNQARLDLYNQAQKLLLNDAAISPLFNLIQPVLVKPWVKGLTTTGLDGEIKGDYSLFKTYIAAH